VAALKLCTVDNTQYTIQKGAVIPADLIRHFSRGVLESAGYKVDEYGIPICHSHLGLMNAGVQGMIANPVILGKLMHEIVQKHLLNKKYFKHKEYVDKCADLRITEIDQSDVDLATQSQEALIASAETGMGQVVTKKAKHKCYLGDRKRHSKLENALRARSLSLLLTALPHNKSLGVGITTALATIEKTLQEKGNGAKGYRADDFKGPALKAALTAFLGGSKQSTPPLHSEKVGSIQAKKGLKNPYTTLSQEFLRHRLFEDFEGTMARHQNGSTMIKGMSALAKDSTSDKATKAMLTRLHELNDAAAGAVLHHIQPGQYDRHVRLAKLHEAALSILGSTHAAGLPKQPQGSPPPALTKEQAELDRAKVKIAYHRMKGLDNDVLMQTVNYKVKQKDRPAAQAKIDAEKDAHRATVQKLHDAYQAAASDPDQIKALAATLPDPPKPPKKPKPKP